jgi:hypothetical protein
VKTKLRVCAAISFGCLLSLSGQAKADVTLVKPADNWEVYTSGRVGGFAELVEGHGIPQPPPVVAPNPTRSLAQEGISLNADSSDGTSNTAGHALVYRVRSGFLGNILSLGVRNHLTDSTTVTAQISLWSTAETAGERTYLKDITDAREGYLKVEGPGGTLLVGRALSLFGRGATEIDFLYGHGYGVGAPQGFNDAGPSAGHIGFGVLANVFTAGVAYATPAFNGLQLTVGYYDPGVLVGQRYSRARLGRPEAEATYDAKFNEDTKLHVFVDGAFQRLYDSQGTNDHKNVYGVQAGARLELGIFHVGVAAFSGKGLGVNYFLSQSDSINNQISNNMRPFDGGYVQTQLVVHKFDFNVGAGITRAHQMSDDFAAASTLDYLKSQRGVSAVVVYHFAKYLHGALDYFRADTDWWGGEKQGVNSFNAGMTVTW